MERNDDEVTAQGDLPDNATQGTPDAGGRGPSEPSEAHTVDAEPDKNADASAKVDEAIVAALLGEDVSAAQTPRQDEGIAALAEEASPEAAPAEQGAATEPPVSQTPAAVDAHFPKESKSDADTGPVDQAAVDAVVDMGGARGRRTASGRG